MLIKTKDPVGARIGSLFFMLSLLIGVTTGLIANSATAGAPGGLPAHTPTLPPCNGAYHYFLPEDGSPSSGDTIETGQQFVLDMMINTGGFTVSAHQSYLTFTYQLLDNVSPTATSCALAGTLVGAESGSRD